MRIAILTQTVLSPSTKAAVARFQQSYPNTVHVAYDPVSEEGALNANAALFGKRALPEYRLQDCNVLVSFGADYLGSWGSAIQNKKGWASRRKPTPEKPDMLRSYQFESWMSTTGANADYRIPLNERMVAAALLQLHTLIASKTGAPTLGNAPSLNSELADQRLRAAADELLANRGASAVFCGLNDADAQMVCNSINSMLGNYGKTLRWDRANLLKQGSDARLAELMTDMKAGKVDLLLINGCNPVYDVPGFADALSKVATKVAANYTADETAQRCDFILPEHHVLESWNDAEPFTGVYSLTQPTISPLFQTRQFPESLLKWSGASETWYDFMSANWKNSILAAEANAEAAWTHALQHGVYERSAGVPVATLLSAAELFAHTRATSMAPALTDSLDAPVAVAASTSVLSGDMGSAAERLRQKISVSGDAEVVVFESPVIGNGAYTDNPWLQETLDSITKVCWDNYAMVNPGWAREQGLGDGDHVKLTTQAGSITVPVLLQPGQAKGTFAVALGYGRTATGHPSTDNGANAYKLLGANRSSWSLVNWAKDGGKTEFARNQVYDSLFDDSQKKRPHVKETTLEEYAKDPMSGNHDRQEILGHLKSFYPDRFANKNGFHWGMAVDLNSCIGCGACHVACQSENNIPVVGKKEMARKHDMHWIRIDRYYAGTEDNPEVVFQPMMCQHCDQAPCENVCPVAATNHSSEGINQMAYNRCIGTRYCANNCPYKVRRFNWFDYMGADSFGDYNDMDPMKQGKEFGQLSDLTRMVLNPDVTVRSRGVMEKCSFCVQRIQESKLAAKMDGRALVDGDVKTACQTACTTGAITFGNLFDNASRVYQLSENNDRAFRVIEEFHTLPSVTYLTKVRNKKPADHIHLVPFEGTLDQA
jgi:molybdopterin-containing oxidoreductase family iron-sulfur binding subunit